MEEEIYVVWRDEVRRIDIENVGSVIKGFLEIVPKINREKKNREIELIYNRFSDGIFENVEESLLIAPAAELVKHYYEYDRESRTNAEIFGYKVDKWAVKLYKYEDNFNRLQWETRDAQITIYGRAPAKIRRLIEHTVVMRMGHEQQ